jgi:hypothetical protein
MATRKRARREQAPKDGRLFTLEVELIGGPVTEEFLKKNPVVSRTVQMRADQPLEDLHFAIFDAFGRDDEHTYQFEFGGKEPMDRRARRYVMPEAMEDPFGDAGDAGTTEADIGSLGLKENEVCFYWFDFGDDWWHRITVKSIAEHAPAGTYPKITYRVGQSPPQYPGLDDEEEDEDQ